MNEQSHDHHHTGIEPCNLPQVSAVADLLADGATIPFIARYRKEGTGSLDEVVPWRKSRDRLEQQLRNCRNAVRPSLNHWRKTGT